jgi:Na+/melibiose symporter-like transporter
MSDLLKEEQRLYEIEQKKASKSGWKRWLKIVTVYVCTFALLNLVGWIFNLSSEAEYQLTKLSLYLVTGLLFLCKALGVFLWKKDRLETEKSVK